MQSGLTFRALRPIERVLDELETQGVRYCHWKGNARLEAALSGERDLDLLVDATATGTVTEALARIGFRRLVDAPGHGVPGVEHYLALAEPRGVLVHLHLHWQLVPTKGNHRWHHLPWEELVLSTRVRHESLGVFVPRADVELLIFLVCAALRVRAKHLVAETLGRPFMDAASIAELKWLSTRATSDALFSRAASLVGERAAGAAVTLMTGPLSARALRGFRACMEPPATQYRANTSAQTIRRMLAASDRAKRTLPSGGRVVVFLGSDGAGKSTVVRAISSWLGGEIEVQPTYFGSGDGAMSLPRRSLRTFDRVRRFVTRRRPRTASLAAQPLTAAYSNGSSYVAGVTPGARAFWKIASKLALAAEKRDRLANASRSRTRGAVIICDRYPQTQQPGFNDGPMLTPWLEHPSRILRSAAQRELAVYRAAAAMPPDLVIKLVVSPETAAARKEDMSIDLLRARGAAVGALRFLPPTRVVEIDADQPLEQVIRAARCAIWEAL